MPVNFLDVNADLTHRLDHDIHICNIRKILYNYSIVCHDCGSENSESRILGSADLHLTFQRRAALDDILFHIRTSADY